jgi:hypothetical protein
MSRTQPGSNPGPGNAGDRGRRGALLLAVVGLALSVSAVPVAAQDANFTRPIPELEERLRTGVFEIQDWRGSRAEGDRTARVLLAFSDSVHLLAKWGSAAPGASMFNNEPRFEVAAYELQKLFLEPAEYVVPPTVLRAFPLAWVKQHSPFAERTFRDVESVLVVLQYWMANVAPDNLWDSRRAQQDTLYARYIGNFNVLTHLVRHNDSNIGNFLISGYEPAPRVFSVDNGVAFSAPRSDRGAAWRDMRVRRLPAHTVQRLRAITTDDLVNTLAVLAEFEVHGNLLVAVEAGENMDPRRGVRNRDGRVQLGLTQSEIDGVANRLRNLLSQIDRGRISEF